MDKLKNLVSSLPPEQPPTDQAVDSLNNEISNEFKTAANSVAKLYRLSNEKNSLLKHKGYLDCLDDILSLLSREGESPMGLHDVQLWCMKRRNELLSSSNSHVDDTSQERLGFSFSNDDKSLKPPIFVLSMPPPSVEQQVIYPTRTNTRGKSTKKTPVTERPEQSSNTSSADESWSHVDKKAKY